MRKGRTPFIVAVCALALTASMAVIGVPPASATNILQNSSFETASGSMPANWSTDSVTGVTYTYQTTGGFDGSRYMRIANSAGTGLGRLYQAVAVQPNSIYTLSLYARTSSAPGSYFGSYIGGTRDTNNSNPGEGNTYAIPTDTASAWQHLTRTVTTGAETSTQIEIDVAGVTTSVDVDLVTLDWTAALPVPTAIVQNGSFETASGSTPANWTTDVGSIGSATYGTDGGYDGSHYMRLAMTATSGTARIYQPIAVTPSTTYTISVRARTVGATSAWFGGDGTGGTLKSPFDTNNTLWKRYTATFTTGSSQTGWELDIAMQGMTTQLDVDMVTIAPNVNVDYSTSNGTIPAYKMTATNGVWNASSSWQTQKGVDTLKTQFDYMRMNIPTALVSSSEGNYNWKQGDEIAYGVANKQGAQIQPLIVGTMPKWLSSNATDPYYFAYPPTDNSKWAQVAVDEVSHYNASPFSYNIKYVDIWNEPNLAGSWNGTQQQYFSLYSAAATALRSSDSTLKLGTGMAALDPKWMQAFLDYVKANSLPLDFIGWHRYTSDPNTYDRDLAQVKQWLSDRSMTSVEIVVEEMNYGISNVAGTAAGPEAMDNYTGAEQEISVMDHMATQGVPKVIRYKDKSLWAPHAGVVGDYGLLFADDSPKKSFFIHKAYNMFNEATSPTNTGISASGAYRDLDVLAGKNTTTGSTTLMFVNKTDDVMTTNLNLTNLPYTGGGWVETSYHVTWNYDWQVDAPVSHTASSSLSRALDLPPRSTTIIRLKSGSSSETPSSKTIDMVADAHNGRWETGDGQFQWDTLRGMPGLTNQLNNGGFEGGLWSDRSTSGITLDTTAGEVDAGTNSAKFVGTTSQLVMGTPLLAVSPASHYRLEARVKSTSVSTADGFSIGVLQYNSSGGVIGWASNDGGAKLISTGGTDAQFRKLAADVVNLDPATTNVKVYVVMDAGVTGTAFIDQVRFSTYNFEPFGDFETWPDAGSDPLGLIVKTANWSPDTTTYKNGDASAKVTSGTTDQTFALSKINVSPTSQYSLSSWIRTHGVTTLGNVGLWLHQYDSAGAEIGTAAQKLTATSATVDTWTKFAITLNDGVNNLNSSTRSVKLELRMLANAGGTAWFDDTMLVGSVGIASRQGNVKMEDGTTYTQVLAVGTPWKTMAASASDFVRGAYRRIDVPATGTVTVSATGGFKSGWTGQTGTFSIKWLDMETGANGTVGTAITHAYTAGGPLVSLSGTLPSTLAGKRVAIYLEVDATVGLNADQAAWTSASITFS